MADWVNMGGCQWSELYVNDSMFFFTYYFQCFYPFLFLSAFVCECVFVCACVRACINQHCLESLVLSPAVLLVIRPPAHLQVSW